MKYHLLAYDAKSYACTLKSINLQNKGNIDVTIHYIDKQCMSYKKGPLYAYYIEIMQIPDDEVVILLDGGDIFAHEDVFSEIDHLYTVKGAWLTYGGSILDGSEKKAADTEVLLSDIMNRKAREGTCREMHLKTFYAGLFKKIKLPDLLVDGLFPETGFDYPLMLPMLEMAEDRAHFSKDILHIRKVSAFETSHINLASLNSYSVIDNIS